MNKIISCFLLLALFVQSGCKDDPLSYEAQLAKDIEKIETYLNEKGLTAQETASGLHYIIETEGTGSHPNSSSTVTVHYKGYYLDGDVFDQTTNTPATFSLQSVIVGWQEGIPLLKKEGKGKLLLPSALAYGSNPPNGVQKNAVMVFEVELVDF